MLPGQQNNNYYSQYGVFWLYNWFQPENNSMNIYFLMNGNIFNYSLASPSEQYMLGENCWWSLSGQECFPYYAYAIPPNPPGIIFCPPTIGKCELLFAQSYINAYNTAFNQSTPGFSGNYQEALNKYYDFNYSDVNNNFIPGTFGSREYVLGEEGTIEGITQSNIIVPIHHLQDDLSVYTGTPYLFVSAGSGGEPGFMYLDWIIVTYGVPYVVSVS
jgi:hypothetical protein